MASRELPVVLKNEAAVIMTDAQRNHLKTVLDAKRQEVARGIRAHTAELAISEGEYDAFDKVQSMKHRDEAAIMLGRLSHILSDVDAALRAVSEGLYGDCADCGRPISLKRLETIPWASRCIRCQELWEERHSTHAAPPVSLFEEDREAA